MSYDEVDLARDYFGVDDDAIEPTELDRKEARIVLLTAEVAKLKREHKMLVQCLEEARDDVEKGQMPSYAYMQRTLAAWGGELRCRK